MEKTIMLAFVSVVSPFRIKNPVNYENIQGEPYTSIQTNESAVVYVERMLKKNSLSKIFLITSDKVKNEFIEGETEFGKVKHLEFLKRRLVKEFPQLADKFVELNYSDDAELEINISQIAKIADAITNYAKNFPDEKIKIHADMTGGFRHISMLMLSVIQLLKYRGIEIGEILYSDPDKKIVYRANEIQKVFTLITGADEFVKFGSVEALQEYFADNPNTATTELLNSMKKFSETIKICRTSDIENDLKNLGVQIKIFRDTKNEDVKSKLFEKIIETVETEYGILIKGNATRPDIIRWCMKKGFWQQAMTLCTEWLPLEIINRKIFEPTSEFIKKAAENDGLSLGRGWQQHFIISYQQKNRIQVENELLSNFCRDLRKILTKLPDSDAINSITRTHGILKNLVAEHSKGHDDFNNGLPFNVFKKKYPLLYQAFQFLHRNKPGKKKIFEFPGDFDYDKFFVTMASLKTESLIEILKINRVAAINFVMKKMEVANEPKWKNRASIYREMLQNGVAKSKFHDQEKVLQLLNGYYEIRRERNQLNHANGAERKEISALEKMIVNYLDEIEKI